MTTSIRFEPLDPGNRRDVDAVADLHVEYLGDSPIVSLGPLFLRRFYYTALVRDEIIGCTVCKADGQVVGFISYTRYPTDLMSRGVRRHFARLSLVMLLTVLTRPRTLVDVYRVLRLMGGRTGTLEREGEGRVGEVVSLAVQRGLRSHVPSGREGRVAGILFEEMVTYFRTEGFDTALLLVQPKNTASNLFCTTMGCRFEKVVIDGKPVHRYTYAISRQPREVSA